MLEVLRKRITCPQGVTLDPHLGQHPALSVAAGNWRVLVPQQASKKAEVSKRKSGWHLWVCWSGHPPTRLLPALLTHPAALLAPRCTLPGTAHRMGFARGSLGQPYSTPWKKGWRVEENTLPHWQTFSHHSAPNFCRHNPPPPQCFRSILVYCAIPISSRTVSLPLPSGKSISQALPQGRCYITAVW